MGQVYRIRLTYDLPTGERRAHPRLFTSYQLAEEAFNQLKVLKFNAPSYRPVAVTLPPDYDRKAREAVRGRR